MEKFDREKKYSPKKRHGNRKPVVPVYVRPNQIRVLNAAMGMLLAFQKDGNQEGEQFAIARDHFYKRLDEMDTRSDHIENVINYLDNQID